MIKYNTQIFPFHTLTSARRGPITLRMKTHVSDISRIEPVEKGFRVHSVGDSEKEPTNATLWFIASGNPVPSAAGALLDTVSLNDGSSYLVFFNRTKK